MSVHETHPEIVARLKRADGHLRKIIAMIEGGRSCVDVAQQMHAVSRAIDSAKAAFIQDHVDHCLEGAVRANGRGERAVIAEFKAIAKYL